MNFDPQMLRESISLIGSGLALASTLYFWLVRANRERPQIEIHPVAPLTGTVLMNEDFETYQAVNPASGHLCAKYFLNLAVVNQSTLPNAVLGVRVWMQLADHLWREMTLRPVDESGLPLPANLPPMSTVPMRLALAVAIAGERSGGFREREQAAGDALHPSLPIRVKISALGGKSFVCEWNDSGEGLLRENGTDRGNQAAA